jgi:RNA polymerase sigma-70 factor (ECF subfamily)
VSDARDAVAAVLRAEHGRILAGLIRALGDFDLAEDALAEAACRALERWPGEGVPRRPGAWLTLVARRHAIDLVRRGRRWARDDAAIDALAVEPDADEDALEHSIGDDRLRLLFTCCHPALAPPAQLALTLRTLGGLTTREIARALVEAEETTAQRLVRAKRKIAEARIPYVEPGEDALPERLPLVLRVVYVTFAEGHAATAGDALVRDDLCRESIRLAALLAARFDGCAEAHGLLALLHLQHARRAARLDADGALVPLEAQDRSLWDADAIAAGREALHRALALRTPGPYQIQAAIAERHAAARTAAETDWVEIAALYAALLRHEPTPTVELNAAVAAAMARGPAAGLEWIGSLERRGELGDSHYLPAAKADLLRRAGAGAAAADAYREALRRCANAVERRYLERRLAEVSAG